MRVLLLAGGGGTRLWPLSSEARPKQFLPLLSEKSLLVETFERVAPLAEEIFVATARRHVDLVRGELPGIPPHRILAEPARRNSGPAILSAALEFEKDGDPITAAIPSDQTVKDAEAFRRTLIHAETAADGASVVVLGVPPVRPEMDYGYLEVRANRTGEGMEVVRFIEKPAASEAEGLIRSGCLWNAGVFLFRPSRLLAEARRVSGDLLRKVENYRELLDSDQPQKADRAYAELPDISIDYAVMEKARHVRAIRLEAGWSDVGTWRSIRDLRGASDESGNLVLSELPVVAPGVRNSAIVVAPEGVLVLPFDSEGELRAGVRRIRGEEPAVRNR